MSRLRAALVAFAIASVPAAARADASIWEKAKSNAKPGAIDVDQLHKQVAVLYTKALLAGRTNDPILGGAAIAVSALEGARALLEANGAATSNDPRLRYDLGLVLARLRQCPKAVPVLEGAVKLAPMHPFAEEGWFELAICHSRLGQHDREEQAYLGALEIADRRSTRAIIYSNLAESRMAQGKLAEAADAAEASIAIYADNPAAHYNLAIVRDRQGEPFAALESAKHAVSYDPDLDYLLGDEVFFEPEHERHWYLALANLATAENEIGDARKDLLMAALMHYQKWLDAAAIDDRYRPRAEEAIARLEKLLGLSKPKPKPPPKK